MNPAERSPAERDELLSRLYREAAGSEPPAGLDQAILSAARAEGRPAPRRAAVRRSWFAPAGLAMAALIAVAIGLVIERESRTGSRSEPAAGERSGPAAPGEPAAGDRSAPAPAREPARGDTPFPAARQAPASQEGLETRLPAPAPAVAAPAAGTRASKNESDARHSPEPEKSAAPPEVAGKLPATAADEARENTSLRKAAPAAGAGAPAAAGAAPAPEQWIEKIRQLRAEGREDEARQALAQFRQVYPDHPLPEDLR
jgi:hypothetical protein